MALKTLEPETSNALGTLNPLKINGLKTLEPETSNALGTLNPLKLMANLPSWSLGSAAPGSGAALGMGQDRGGFSPTAFSAPGSSGPGHLESIGRRWELHPEEHRSLPPVGSGPPPAPAVAPTPVALTPPSTAGLQSSPPSSFSSQASAAPLLAAQGPGMYTRISVPKLMDDGRLGLIIQNCWVSSISNPIAAQWGWQVGDHILQVNGHAVSNMQQLSDEIRRAVNSHQTVAHPLVFDVWRPASLSAAAGAAPGGAPRRQNFDCCSAVDCCGDPDPAPALPPAAGGYAQVPQTTQFSAAPSVQGAFPPPAGRTPGAQRRRALC
ncbi:unnamed protein product [Symbiodinium natans]|uniref:PDZ domain-containing protein n=1 Tax=Symbiodinium natans TaxID=878477 RepID=A0A812ILA6_9DINO|nr:unnamed protein product [Symbiodinium natans]